MNEFRKNLVFTWRYSKKQKSRIIAFVLCSFLHIVISVIVPIISAKIIINFTSNQLNQVLWMGLVLFIIELFRNLINYLCNYFSQVIYRETFTDLQLNLGKEILSLTNSCLDHNSSGVFIQRLTNDTSKISDIFNLLSFNLIDVLTDIGIFGAIFIINRFLFFYVMVMVIIIGIIEKRRVSIRIEKDKEFRRENEKVSGFVGELVRGVRDIKMLSAEESFLRNLNERLLGLNAKRYEMSKVQRSYYFISGSLRDFFDFSMICILVYFISQQKFTIALALVIYNYMRGITYIVNSYSYLLEGIKDFNLSCNRIFEIIDGKDFPKEKFGKMHLDSVEGNFEFSRVSFGYSSDDLILKDLSFKIKANSTVAFVGKSGAGKSTIFNLLCKMYEVNSGNIFIDGENILSLDRESIRDNITIISQNPYIFNLSIRDNLRLVKEDVTDEEMIDACQVACLDEFINSLPEKYDTIVGEGGISLSGGQRQRLAIARALIQKTEIILFDEATSALDNETQTQIQKAIDNMKESYTILIIAHRLSTIINCDRILYLEDGKIVAEGTHKELLEKSLEYRKLYQAEIEK